MIYFRIFRGIKSTYMKQVYIIFSLVFLLSGAAIAEHYEVKPKPGKHKSHKKAKKKKSKYMYNFQS